MDDIKQRIRAIYEAHKESGLYNDSFENVIYKLTNAYDYFYLEPFRKIIDKARKNMQYSPEDKDWEKINEYRHAYRACIKFVCEDCKRGVFRNKVDLNDIRDYQQEIKDTVYFNYLRNTIDRYKLGRYSANIINDELCFKHIEGERSLVYDAYSRHIADEIPGAKNSKDDLRVLGLNITIGELSSKKLDFQSRKIYKPFNHALKEMIDYLYNYYLGDLDCEIGDLQIASYSLEHYLLVYCYIAAIGVFKTAYLLSLKSDNDLVYQPSILYPKERLVLDVSEVTGVDEDSVRTILKDMTYDYDFHKDRVTLYQPIFEVGDNILCSTNILFHSYVIDKVTRYFDSRGTNKDQLTNYHRYMSNKMNHRMAENLPLMYEHLHTYENKSLFINKTVQAEIDLIIFDEISKHAALVELKNYTPVDNDFDANRKEEKINFAIQSRKEKDKRVLDNLELFFKQNNLPKKYLSYNFASMLVTNLYAGGVGVKEEIKVLDEALFYFLLRAANGNLADFIEYVDKGSFFDMLAETICFGDADIHYTYKGITVEIINK